MPGAAHARPRCPWDGPRYDPAVLPVHFVGIVEPAHDRPGDHYALLDGGPIVLDHGGRLLPGYDAGVRQAVRVPGAGGGVGADLLIHHGLGDRRLVRLVVTQAAVADQVDDHILMKLVAEVQRQLGDEDHRLRVVAVDVEDRGLDYLGHIGTTKGRAGIQGVAGGKA